MRCKKCGTKYQHNERDRNIEMSVYFLCFHCENHDRLKIGDWYQDEKGEYKQKDQSND